MKNLLKLSLLTTAIATTLSIAEGQKHITIGTGGKTGVYYAAGQSICELVNLGIKEHGVACDAPSTGGSVYNAKAIVTGEQDMATVQSDVQFHAYSGTSTFEGKPNKELRAVFSIHPEPFTVVARANVKVNHFTDIKGKRVNIGEVGSGTQETTKIAMKAMGISADDLALKSELELSKMAAAFCDHKLDVITYVVGHPSDGIREASTSCRSKIVPVTGAAIDRLVADTPYYAKVTIPGGMYKGSPQDINTFGVYATLVSSTKTDDETIYQVVKAVFDNFKRFKVLHPAFRNLKESDMIHNALSAPLHDGAIRFYKEKGWLDKDGKIVTVESK